MKISKDEAVSLFFKWVIFHPETNVRLFTENGIERYEVSMYIFKMFELKYDPQTKKYDMWREQILLDLYEEFELLTNMKPDNTEVRKLLQERMNDDLLEAVKENIDSLYIDYKTTYLR